MLSKMVAELIADHDSVALPGVGTFITAIVPASFSDRGFTIHPPYRKLSFVSYDIGDHLLVDLYARNNSMDPQAAKEILAHFMKELKKALVLRKTVSLPGLGRLRATKDNEFFFVPDENLDIYPEGYGLEPVSLRNTAPEELNGFEAGLSSFSAPFELEDIDAPESAATEPAEQEPAEPEPEPASETNPAPEPTLEANPEPVQEPEPTLDPAPESAPEHNQEPEPESEPDNRNGKKRCRRWIWLLAVVLLVVLAFGAFLLLSYVSPDFIDSLLYTPEELQIVNY